MIDETGVDGVTIARGCIGNPWIFRACLIAEARAAGVSAEALPDPRPSAAELRATVLRHFDLLAAYEGPFKACLGLRKQLLLYARLMPSGHRIRPMLRELDGRPALERALHMALAGGPIRACNAAPELPAALSSS